MRYRNLGTKDLFLEDGRAIPKASEGAHDPIDRNLIYLLPQSLWMALDKMGTVPPNFWMNMEIYSGATIGCYRPDDTCRIRLFDDVVAA